MIGENEAAGRENLVADLEVLRTGCGAVERRWSVRLEVSGEDRVRFLNGYLTCDIGSLAEGEGAYGFFTSSQGRILADAVVTAHADALRSVVPLGTGDALVAHLSKYILADRVELSLVEGSSWLLSGPEAARVVGELTPEPPGTWGFEAAHLGEIPVEIGAEGDQLYSVTAAADDGAAVLERLVAVGATPVAFEAFEADRIERGVLRFGVDFGDQHFPQETGLDDAISYTKGCYLGQEVVARIHYRGHVNHGPRRLTFEGPARPEVGAAVSVDGKVVGRCGSSAFFEERGQTLALAIVHRNVGDEGTAVTVEEGLQARVQLLSQPTSGQPAPDAAPDSTPDPAEA